MKKFFFYLVFIVTTCGIVAQNTRIPQDIMLKDLDGNNISSSVIRTDGKPLIICFWATFCSPSNNELNTIQEVYAEWEKETGVKMVAISVDDARSLSRVKPVVDAYEWPYEFYIDENHAFLYALGLSLTPPHTIIINGKGEIIWRHTGFQKGVEKEIIEKVRSIIK